MARTFSGSSQYLQHGAAAVTAEPLTLACWFNADSTVSAMTMLSVERAGSRDAFHLYGRLGLSVRAAIRSGFAFYTSSDSASGYSSGAWYHAAAVFASTTSRTAYLNGTAGTTDTNNTAGLITSLVSTNIGGLVGGAEQWFDGSIAGCGIWNVALTDSEIASLAAGHCPSLVRPDALLAYYPLFDNDGDADWWGQYNMTAGGSPTYVQQPPMIYPGGIQTFIPVAAGGGGGTAGFGLTRSKALNRMRLVG